LKFLQHQSLKVSVTLNTYLDIFLRVTDQDGLMTEATRIIQPSLLSVEIGTNPSGLKVLVDEEPVRTSKRNWS
jgi:hypothetical protein